MPRKRAKNLISELADAAVPALTLLHASHPANRLSTAVALALRSRRRGALMPMLGAVIAVGVLGFVLGRASSNMGRPR